MKAPSHDPRLLTRAVQLAKRGWHVFPLRPGDKRPLPGFTKWEARATTEPAQIIRWWTAAPYNIGIATGPSGLLVIDCDVPRGGHASQWHLRRDSVEITGHPVPKTFTVRTPSGGLHLYFSAPGPPLGNTAGKLSRQIDTRGLGGHVVGPGSVCGVGYYRVIDNSFLEPLPEWITDALSPTVTTVPTARAPQLDQDRYVRAILEGEARRVRTAKPGTRNIALNTAAFIMGQLVGSGEITEEHAWRLLRSAGRLHIGVEGFTQSELERTAESGLTAGMHQPRSI
jgi:hypothetical protein